MLNKYPYTPVLFYPCFDNFDLFWYFFSKCGKDLLFFRCKIYLQGLRRTYLDTPTTSNALCYIYDRFALFIHLNGIFRAVALAAGCACYAFSRNKTSYSARFLYFVLLFFHTFLHDIYILNIRFSISLSINNREASFGSLTPSPIISPLALWGENIFRTKVAEPLSPIVFSFNPNILLSHNVAFASSAINRIGTVGYRRLFISFNTAIIAGRDASTISCLPSSLRLTLIFFAFRSILSIRSTSVNCEYPRRVAIPGPTWAVSPSMVCLPQITIETSSFVPSFFMASERTRLVARVSAPPKARSLRSTASSAPSAMVFFSVTSAFGGPIEITAM